MENPNENPIITGDETRNPPLIYAITTNGVVTTNDTTSLIPEGIYPEDFDVIPANHHLYACDPVGNAIIKLSATYLTNFVGDLIITDAGESSGQAVGRLFAVRWDAGSTNFLVRRIQYKRPDGLNGRFEHITFAPIDLQAP